MWHNQRGGREISAVRVSAANSPFDTAQTTMALRLTLGAWPFAASNMYADDSFEVRHNSTLCSCSGQGGMATHNGGVSFPHCWNVTKASPKAPCWYIMRCPTGGAGPEIVLKSHVPKKDIWMDTHDFVKFFEFWKGTSCPQIEQSSILKDRCHWRHAPAKRGGDHVPSPEGPRPGAHSRYSLDPGLASTSESALPWPRSVVPLRVRREQQLLIATINART